MRRWGLLALLALAATPLGAQRVAPPATGADSAVVPPRRTTTAVILETEPNKVHVITIAVPEELRGRSVHYTFVHVNTFGVLGRLEGDVAADQSDRPLALSIAIPSTAAAGRTTVGLMRFSCTADCEDLDVPVIVNVLPSYALRITAARSLLGSHSGGRAQSSATIRNAGNATEVVSIGLEVPSEWRARVLTALPLTIEAGATTTVEFEVLVAPNAPEGDYGMVVRATGASGATAFTAISVRVEAGQHGIVGWRPSLQSSAAAAADARGNLATALGADLSGEVLPDVRANGRLNLIHDDGASNIATQSLGRLGYAAGSGYLYITAPSWETGVGTLGYSDAGLAGSGLYGLGAIASMTRPEWNARMLAVSPTTGAAGHYLYSEAAHRLGSSDVTAGLIASDLRDDIAGGRTAQTFAGELMVPWRGGSASLQAGYRDGANASGLGWLARVDQRTKDWSVGIRAGESPGGTAALARANNDLQIDASRSFGDRVSIGAGYWKTADGDFETLHRDARTTGGSLNGQLGIGSLGRLSFSGRTSDWNQRSSAGTFTTADRATELAWTRSFGALEVRAGASAGTVSRGTVLDPSFSITTKADQRSYFANLGSSTGRGDFQASVRREATGAGVGVPTAQTTFTFRADRVPVFSGRARLHGESMVYVLGATRSALSSQRVGITTGIGADYGLTVDIERNQFFGAGNGVSPWVLTTKLERAIGLPALRGGTPRGLVFADLNGDGVPSQGEPGVRDVVVRVDGNLTTTDANGRFEAGRGRVAEVSIDPRSLPAGWIVAPSALRATAPGQAIRLAVIPTSPVEVTLSFGETQGIDTAKVHFDRAIVVLTDSLGRSWTGTPDARGVLRLDALPPGLYEISAELENVGETLVLPQPLPTVRVQGGTKPIKATLKVSARPIRRIDPSKVPPPIRRVGGGSDSDSGQSPDAR